MAGALRHRSARSHHMGSIHYGSTMEGGASAGADTTASTAEMPVSRPAVMLGTAEPARLAAAIEALPAPVVLAFQGEPRLTFNASARELFAAHAPTSLAEHVDALQPTTPGGDLLGVADVPLARALRGETVEGVRLRVRAQDGSGEALRLEADAHPVFANGRLIGAACTYRDVTTRELDDEMADDLLGTAAHDLRTPLTALKASAQLVARGYDRLDEAARARTLSLLLAQVEKLSGRIDDVLDASRIRRGRLDVTLGEIDATELLDRLVAELAPCTPRIEAHIDRELHARGDRGRIEQVVRKLVQELGGPAPADATALAPLAVEAHKTPAGGVAITVRGPKDAARRCTARRLAIAIADKLGGTAREIHGTTTDAVELVLPPANGA
jgi:signal transduction histidine kinase